MKNTGVNIAYTCEQRVNKRKFVNKSHKIRMTEKNVVHINLEKNSFL